MSDSKKGANFYTICLKGAKLYTILGKGAKIVLNPLTWDILKQ